MEAVLGEQQAKPVAASASQTGNLPPTDDVPAQIKKLARAARRRNPYRVREDRMSFGTCAGRRLLIFGPHQHALVSPGPDPLHAVPLGLEYEPTAIGRHQARITS